MRTYVPSFIRSHWYETKYFTVSKLIKILFTDTMCSGILLKKRDGEDNTMVRFEIFTEVTMKNAVFWDVEPCISCLYWRFGGIYRLSSLQPSAHAGSSLADFLLWRWRQYIPPKRRFTQDLHSTTSQNTAVFIIQMIWYPCVRIKLLLFGKCR
jgi:hypothetical protein